MPQKQPIEERFYLTYCLQRIRVHSCGDNYTMRAEGKVFIVGLRERTARGIWKSLGQRKKAVD